MTGKNLLKQQLKTGNVDMPLLSDAIKESGAVSIELTILPEHPEETSGSSSEETETGRRGNTDKGASTDEPEKQAMTRKNEVKQQLQTGNVNMLSETRTLKKSGSVRTVHASIHERPHKTRRSLTERKAAVKKMEKIPDKEAFDKEVEPEKSRLPQDTLQQEIRKMRSKSPLKQRLQTGNINTQSESGALKKSGAVDFVLVTVHEHPKETCGSPSKQKGTGEMKQGHHTIVAANTPGEELEETSL